MLHIQSGRPEATRAILRGLYGSQVEIKVVEMLKVYDHFWSYRELPPGNRIFR